MEKLLIMLGFNRRTSLCRIGKYEEPFQKKLISANVLIHESLSEKSMSAFAANHELYVCMICTHVKLLLLSCVVFIV